MGWTIYKHGLFRYSPDPTGTAGKKLNDNVTTLGDYLDTVALLAAGAVSGHLASLTGTGQPADSGIAASAVSAHLAATAANPHGTTLAQIVAAGNDADGYGITGLSSLAFGDSSIVQSGGALELQGDTDIHLNPSGGNVSIGTATTSSLLTILKNSAPSLSHTHVASIALASVEGAYTILEMGTSATSPYPSWLQTRHATVDGSYYPIALNPLGGSVGIGTSSPVNALDVNGGATVRGAVGYSLGTPGVYVGLNAGHGVVNAINPGAAGLPLDISGDPITFNSANSGAELGRFHTNGNFGIGTTSPAANLTVMGSALVGNAGAASVGTDYQLQMQPGSQWGPVAKPGVAVHVDDGAFNASLRLRPYSGPTGTAPDVLTVTATGVGIGTTTPTSGYMAHVQGAAYVHDHITANGWGFIAGGDHGPGGFYGYTAEISGTVTAGKFVGQGIVPIGTVTGWLKNFTGTPALPAGWVEANGQVLSDAASPYNGATLPDLNGALDSQPKFLRGATTSGGSGGSDTASFTPYISTSYTGVEGYVTTSASYVLNYVSTGPNYINTVPAYYAVVWIVRVK